ncbi:Uncharacterised protein [Vibrio cholerae]|nr:Uncharacterised protein [Vibrio cholerae]CSC38781.1 Uncharacterised protein [Vibrio cholerae]
MSHVLVDLCAAAHSSRVDLTSLWLSVMGIIFYGVTLIIAFIWVHESELAYHPLSLHVVWEER